MGKGVLSALQPLWAEAGGREQRWKWGGAEQAWDAEGRETGAQGPAAGLGFVLRATRLRESV